MSRERRAFICDHVSHEVPLRRFVAADDPEPRCPDGHGKMKRQANVPYEPNPDPERVTIGKRVNAPRAKAKRAR